MPGINLNQPLLGAGAAAKNDWASASARTALDFTAQAEFKRGINVTIGISALAQADAGLAQFVASTVRGNAFAEAEASVQVQFPLNLFQSFGVAVGAQAKAQAAAGIEVGLGLVVGDFVELIQRDPEAVGIPLEPFRAVAFLLSLAGHRRAGAAKPVELHKRIRLMANGVNTALRTRMGLDYDPLDIIEFNSFDDLLRKRPPGGTVWQSIIVVTHAGGEAPAEFPGEIFLGDKAYVVSSGGINDLLDAINAKLNRVNQFRAQFDDPSNLTLIGCGVGAAGPDVAIYMRELFGTEGLIMYPLKNVDFFANGDPGTPKDPEKPKVLRRLTDADWEIVTRKDDILNAVDPIVLSDF